MIWTVSWSRNTRGRFLCVDKFEYKTRGLCQKNRPRDTPLMKHTQSILIKVGILIDSNENKVSIDTQLHKYLHTTAYKAYIILGVEIAYRSGGTWNEQRDNVLEFLRKVKAILEMASDTVKYLY